MARKRTARARADDDASAAAAAADDGDVQVSRGDAAEADAIAARARERGIPLEQFQQFLNRKSRRQQEGRARRAQAAPAQTQSVAIAPEQLGADATEGDGDDDADAVMATAEPARKVERPQFAPLRPSDVMTSSEGFRRIPIPVRRMAPLKAHWMDIYTPIVEKLHLQILFDTQAKCVEIKTSPETPDVSFLQKAADFVRAFALGFELADALSLVRLDNLYLESFEVKDVRMTLHHDNLSRAVGRIAGSGGKTKLVIENTTRTRIVLADTHIHILGGFNNIRVARDAICDLIIGSPPGKIFQRMKTLASRIAERG